ncbi:acyltransferase family protein [Enterococcus sp. LJL120]
MQTKPNYNLLYVTQFICSLFIVVVHSGTLTENPELHFVIKTMICRVTVPFFLVVNAFFFRQKNAEERKIWLKKILQTYLFWSLIYLPLGLQFVQQELQLSGLLLIPAALVGLIYTGIYYHLWYFPALLFSLYVVPKLLRKFGYIKLAGLLLLLYIIGASETYSAFITMPFLKNILNGYLAFFFTTRNGVFFSSIFILMGFFIADHFEKIQRQKSVLTIGLLASFVLMAIEGPLIYANQGIDKNFLFFLLPLLFFGFPLLLKASAKKSLKPLKKAGQFIFFVHLLPIEIFNTLTMTGNEVTANLGWTRLFLGVFIPILLLRIGHMRKRRQGNTIFLEKAK